MHKPIEDGLEAYLSGRASSAVGPKFLEHLDSCEDCRLEVEALREQAEWMRLLRAPESFEPAAGFYARVMDRIESQRPASLWDLLLDPMIGRRLMYASLVLFVVLGSAVWRTSSDPVLTEGNPVTIMAAAELPHATGEDVQRDRQVVLRNLATFSDSSEGVAATPVSSTY